MFQNILIINQLTTVCCLALLINNNSMFQLCSFCALKNRTIFNANAKCTSQNGKKGGWENYIVIGSVLAHQLVERGPRWTWQLLLQYEVLVHLFFCGVILEK